MYQLTKVHGYPRNEIIEYLNRHGAIKGDFSAYRLTIEEANKIIEVLSILYKDMERLDKDFGVKRNQPVAV
ncbi:MAG: hypothetical protein M0R32_10975 [Candidatus Cloacimonetes bacterium]|jgi:hypothetical protein|nr:hypothetical protein [Candidatus Cloacimonadota bacterium]